MKQNEIRVGNWLIDPRAYDKELNKKFGVDDSPYFKVTARDIQFAEEYKPIPLTEEILLKCGWGKGEYYSEYIDNVSLKQEVLGYNVNAKMLYIETNADIIEINHIHYLHQLQNLYFALTGQELEVNL